MYVREAVSGRARGSRHADSLNPVARPHRTGVRLPAQLHAMGIVYTIDRAHAGAVSAQDAQGVGAHGRYTQ